MRLWPTIHNFRIAQINLIVVLVFLLNFYVPHALADENEILVPPVTETIPTTPTPEVPPVTETIPTTPTPEVPPVTETIPTTP
ncbi:hypothetical protein KA050_03120, partial [Candidatus Gracilibacteria bacterium]|nr:hypothetical protein [Candidatus Gracilibacteria bacterium]